MVRTRSSTRLTRKPVLPLDVCGIIIDILASDRRDPGLNSVKKCSLVCNSFLPLCRKHIFATIKIDDPLGTLEPSHSDSDEGPHHVLEEFMQLIKHTPAIGNYIHHLELSFEEYDILDDFPRTMQRLTRLESLALSQYNELDWRSLKWPVRNALLRLLQLPTLTALALCFVSDFLVTDLVHGTSLRRLELKSTTFFEDSADAPPTAIVLPAKLVQIRELIVQSDTEATGIEQIANARRSDGLLVIDPTRMTAITIICNCVGDMDALGIFLRRGKKLTKIDLTVPSNLNFVGFADMIAPHIRALKIARLSFSVDVDHDGPLGGIPSELAKLAGDNVFECLRINVDVWESMDSSGDEWGMLDTVLTSSGWPALKTVVVKISLCTPEFENNNLLKSFRRLKKTQFPRLSASKSVDFKFLLRRI